MKFAKQSWLMLFLVIMIILSACGEGTDNGVSLPGDVEENELIFTTETTMQFSNGLDFSSQCGVQTISFVAHKDWYVEIVLTRADSWCSVEPTSGKAGDASFDIKIDENTTPQERVAILTLVSGTYSKQMEIRQKSDMNPDVTGNTENYGEEKVEWK